MDLLLALSFCQCDASLVTAGAGSGSPRLSPILRCFGWQPLAAVCPASMCPTGRLLLPVVRITLAPCRAPSMQQACCVDALNVRGPDRAYTVTMSRPVWSNQIAPKFGVTREHWAASRAWHTSPHDHFFQKLQILLLLAGITTGTCLINSHVDLNSEWCQ